MLTPAKIKNHHFDASGRNGYKAESVDLFFEEVAESYEQMFKENGEMFKKIGLLAERLEEYKNDEDNIRNALLVAQRSAEKITRDAEERAKSENERVDALTNELLARATEEAKRIIDEANKQAEKIIYDATYESKSAAISARDSMIKEEAALEMMKDETAKFKNQILDMYAEQLDLIEKIPGIVREKAEAEEQEAVQAEEEAAEPETVEEPEAEEEPSVDVDVLQKLVNETADEDAAPETVEIETEDNGFFAGVEEESADADTEAEETDESEEDDAGDIVLPGFEGEEETVDEILNEMDSESDASAKDVMFTKPVADDFAGYAEIESDVIDDENELDEDEGDGDGFSTKFKGFFKKK